MYPLLFGQTNFCTQDGRGGVIAIPSMIGLHKEMGYGARGRKEGRKEEERKKGRKNERKNERNERRDKKLDASIEVH